VEEAGGGAEGRGVFGALGSAILKPAYNFYVRWEFLHTFAELYRSILVY